MRPTATDRSHRETRERGLHPSEAEEVSAKERRGHKTQQKKRHPPYRCYQSGYKGDPTPRPGFPGIFDGACQVSRRSSSVNLSSVDYRYDPERPAAKDRCEYRPDKMIGDLLAGRARAQFRPEGLTAVGALDRAIFARSSTSPTVHDWIIWIEAISNQEEIDPSNRLIEIAAHNCVNWCPNESSLRQSS